MGTKADKERLEEKRKAVNEKIQQLASMGNFAAAMMDERQCDLFILAAGMGVVELSEE